MRGDPAIKENVRIPRTWSEAIREYCAGEGRPSVSRFFRNALCVYGSLVMGSKWPGPTYERGKEQFEEQP